MRSLFFIIFLLCFVFVGAQPNEYGINYTNISEQTGIPNETINGSIQDKDGFIWVATWKGLYRYDGYRSVRFSDINPEFTAQKITCIFLDAKGQLWASCFVDGAFVINTENYSVKHYHARAEKEFRIADNNIISISQDDDGAIWLGGESKGLSIIKQNSIEFWNVENDKLQCNQVSYVLHSKKWGKVIGTGCGVYLPDVNPNSSVRKLESSFIYQIKEDANGDLWIANLNGLHKLNFSKNGLVVTTVLNVHTASLLILQNSAHQEIWAGTVSGLVVINTTTLETKNLVFSPSVTPLNGRISNILEATDGTVFFSTEKGFFSLLPKNKAFENIFIDYGLSKKASIADIEQGTNGLWIATWGNGLFYTDDASGETRHIDLKIPEFAGYIYSIKFHEGNLWISAKNTKGVFKIREDDLLKNPFDLADIQHFFKNSYESDIIENVIISACKTIDNELFFGSWDGILFWFDKDNNTIKEYPHLYRDRFLSFPIRSIVKDKSKNIWLATSGKGVFKLSKDSVLNFSEKEGLAGNFATQICVASNNMLWVTTEKGLTRFDKEGQLSNYFTGRQIVDFQSIIEDPSGFLWMGSEKGLYRINSNLSPDIYKFFNTKDGLLNTWYFHQSVFRDKKGRIFFGGNNGIDAFYSHEITFNYLSPIAKLTDFKLFHQRVIENLEYDGNIILRKNIVHTKEVRLEHQQNTFEIEFSNLQYILPEKSTFMYKLEGVDKEWIYQNTNITSAYYTNLRWGDYTFLLRSCNNDGFWNDEPLRLEIEISPPFWASYYAYSFYIIVLIVLVLYFNQRTIIKVKHLHNIELKELEYTSQREIDEAKLRFFTNISHELRTPLTLIIGPLARILESAEKNPHHNYHLLMYRNANRLLKLINRLMDFSKNEQAKLRLKVQYLSPETLIETVFQSFEHEAQMKKIDYKTIYDSRIPKLWFDPEFIESVLFNLVSNAFKYTSTGKSITIKFELEQNTSNPNLRISVSDEGRGISQRNIERIFDRFYTEENNHSGTGIGLSFSKRLVDMHKAKILVDSIPEKGTCFTVVLSLNDIYSSDEKAQLGSFNVERTIDWSKVDIHIAEENSIALDRIKAEAENGQLIALIVDDNQDVRTYVKDMLKDSFWTLEAENGQKALEIAQEFLPDIIVSDVMMPEMDGYQLCEEIKKNPTTDHIPIILTTVLSSADDRIKGLKYGADSYIPKPINPEHLLVRVHQLLEQQARLKRKYSESNPLVKQIAEDLKTTEKDKEVHPLIQKATQVILNRIDDAEYSVEDFCSDLNLSRMQMYRKLKAITGQSANAFIRSVRLKKAAELLATGEYNVKQVTYDVGFNDLKYFRKCFKEEFGTNPSEHLPDKENDVV